MVNIEFTALADGTWRNVSGTAGVGHEHRISSEREPLRGAWSVGANDGEKGQ